MYIHISLLNSPMYAIIILIPIVSVQSVKSKSLAYMPLFIKYRILLFILDKDVAMLIYQDLGSQINLLLL